ncbi:MAG: hypothetical protein ACLPIC_11170 [Rhodoblastus sp.]|uniref:hypothetical protein n=1 Tax=Rhodoblastus sp. TaxID=1962975 RepID=UPI003F9CACB2
MTLGARGALEASNGEKTAADLATDYGVHPTMIHQRKRALLEGAADIFERCGKKKAEIDEGPVQPAALFSNLALWRSTRSACLRNPLP